MDSLIKNHFGFWLWKLDCKKVYGNKSINHAMLDHFVREPKNNEKPASFNIRFSGKFLGFLPSPTVSVFPNIQYFINRRRGKQQEKASSSVFMIFLWKWDLHNTMLNLNSYPTSFAYFVNRILSTFFVFLFFQCEKRGFEMDRCCDTFVSFWQHLDVPSHLTQFSPRSFWLFSHLNSH